MGDLLFILGLMALPIALWTREAVIHRRALGAIPVRIHVNGSRGKSSVTRLLAAALREAGVCVFAKTTGSSARLILPDGTEEPVVRIGSPNVREQIDVLDRARRERAAVIVMECMAIRPDLQRTCEENIMHSTIGVITNVRPDHLDVMGPTLDEVALSLSATTPKNGTLVVGDMAHAEILRKAAARRGTKLIEADVREVPEGATAAFGYLEHEENIATVLEVTRLLEIGDEVAVRGMQKAAPDPGACTRWRIEHNGRDIEFLNVFAANDLQSTVSIWRRLELDSHEQETTIALLNLRGDRIDRSIQFADSIGFGIQADYYVLVGDYTDRVLHRFRRKVSGERLVPLGPAQPQTIFDQISRLGESRARVGGIGNIGGLGHEILRFVAQERSAACRSES